ncbi:leucine rich adaptor protein 1-like [Acanthochromis polyacanthus]|uniref:leucine rich adaptor protein 1-like n=1 Tax=Acanthochromis polyacanthus TaxID=80966 RepID=UPI0022346CCA|nr:leucine rich adaptor protein 1-like [Acanthochromis polyacanthus]
MAEEILNDSLPDLKELESKIGRKTPESLLIWMKDAADCEDEVVDRGDQRSADSFSDKINNLKQEMRWLRSADVRILRQLVALHEGIEAMRWLLEERGTLASQGSSLTGSLSSLATMEEHWPSMSPCRESPSPICLQDLTETSSIESADQQPPSRTDFGEMNHMSYFDVLHSESGEAKPPSPTSSEFILSRSAQRGSDQASLNPVDSFACADEPQSEPLDSDAAALQYIKGGANTIRRALQRSTKRKPKMDAGTFAFTQQSGEKVHQTEEDFSESQPNKEAEEESAASNEKALLGYDAQWCWVESQDDVTFL